MMPAQKRVIWRSVGWARSLNQTQNLNRRNDAPLSSAPSDPMRADTLRPERNARHRQAAYGPRLSRRGVRNRHDAFGAGFGEVDPLIGRILAGEFFFVLGQIFGADLDRFREGLPIAPGLCRRVEFVA